MVTFFSQLSWLHLLTENTQKRLFSNNLEFDLFTFDPLSSYISVVDQRPHRQTTEFNFSAFFYFFCRPQVIKSKFTHKKPVLFSLFALFSIALVVDFFRLSSIILCSICLVWLMIIEACRLLSKEYTKTNHIKTDRKKSSKIISVLPFFSYWLKSIFFIMDYGIS